MTIITRFAPSPTGLLHVGNVRTALVNWLFTKKNSGQFMLRIDDTDQLRSRAEYTDKIKRDLTWLGLEWDLLARQSDRLDRYEEVKQQLLHAGRLYPCYETKEELELKRKTQLSRGLPPIYDRSSLKLSAEKIQQYLKEGRKPHFRFLLNEQPIKWQDGIRGEVSYEAKHLTDPILIREDETVTYILSSVVDDVDFKITDIIRGEDHVTNTAIQIQIFDCLGGTKINFAHLALIKTKDAGISKRTGGFDIEALRGDNFEAMAITNLLSSLGTSYHIGIKNNLSELAESFDMERYGRSPANYELDDLLRVNHKVLSSLSYQQVEKRLVDFGITGGQDFWEQMRNNITKFDQINDWWQICHEKITPMIEDQELLECAGKILPPEPWDETTWEKWTKEISAETSKKGKQLFMPLRKALTGMEHGPELKKILPLLGRAKTLERLAGEVA